MQYINKEKIEKIKFTKSNFYVAIDFDRTITTGESCDSWDASGYILGDGFKKEAEALFQKYRPIELDYSISFEEKNKAMEEWYYGCLDLYYKNHLTKEMLIKSIDDSNLIFRLGVKEFLAEMHENNIPVIILSAGIGNVIERFLKTEKCYYDNIYIISNFLQFDENGNIKPYDGKLIQTLNKTMKGHINNEYSQKLKEKQYRLLLGDLIEDKNMVPRDEWDRTLSVRIYSKRKRG